MNGIIRNKLGKSFPTAMVAGGYALMAYGLFVLLGNILGGLALMLMGSFAAFTSNGIMLHPAEKKYKQYVRYFGIITGKWESYESYPHLAVLKRNMKTVTHSRSMVATSEVTDTYYDLFLLNESHRVKLLVKRLDKPENARVIAEEFSKQLGVEYAAYNPVISARTRSRRR